MASLGSDVALAAVDERNAARLQRIGIALNGKTVEAALVQMVVAMGELATLSYRSSESLSQFENAEASYVLGRMAVALSTMGLCLGVNVYAAALDALREEPLSSASPAPPQQQPTGPGTAATPAAGGTGAMPGTAAASVVLSPTSRDNFFSSLDILQSEPADTFTQLDLRWVVPDGSGALQDLVPGGGSLSVTADAFPAYYALAQTYRNSGGAAAATRAAAAPRNGDPAPTVGGSYAPIETAQRVVATVPGYDAEKEAELFSPTHFSNDLFSPRTNAGAGDVLRGEVRLPVAYAAVVGRAAPQPNGPAHAQTHQQLHAQPSPSPPQSLQSFHRQVEMLRSGVITGPAVARLGLSFCDVVGDQVVELVSDGLQVAVTAANCQEFLHLLDGSRRSARQPEAARVHRMDSVRRLQTLLAPAETDASSFSPSHFQHELFAPYNDKTAVYVDYDESERTLPPALRGKSRTQSPRSQSAPQPQSQQPMPDRTGAARQRAGDVVDSPYMTAVRACDYPALARIIREVRAMPTALRTYGVTYCVPSAMTASPTAVEAVTGIKDIFPAGHSHRVHPNDVNVFLLHIRPYFPALFA